MSVVLYAGSERSSTLAEGRSTRHSFSFGERYDPANLGFGPMLCHNDDDLVPGAGYGEHPHSELEIVTWVLAGALVHTGSTGETHVLEAGRAQVLSAGTGVHHSEIADAGSGPCRFVQTWLAPTTAGAVPSYVAGEAPSLGDGLVEVAGGEALPVGTARARLLVARLSPGTVVALPDSARQHVFVAAGSVVAADQTLGDGDALRVTDEPGHAVRALTGSELLVWSFG